MTLDVSQVSTPLLTEKGGRWAQTDRATHEAWGRLSLKSPRAAALCHFLVAHMDAQTNAVVASWRTLAEMTGMSVATVRRAMRDLEEGSWVEGVSLGGGSAKAWVVNARVAWAKNREGMRYATFNARVLASEAEQPHGVEGNKEPLRRIPTLTRGERQLPTGPGEDPPAQPSLEGLEPDLPAIVVDEAGRRWEVNSETGELQALIEAPDDET